jgi:hypothetical protein
MLLLIILGWILTVLQAPTWVWVIFTLLCVVQAIKFMIKFVLTATD